MTKPKTEQADRSGAHRSELIEGVVEQFLSGMTNGRGMSPLTESAYRADLTRFLEWAKANLRKHLRPRDVTHYNVVAFKDDLHMAPRTIHRKLATLQAFFGWCEERGMVETNPARGIKLPKAPVIQPRPLSEDELAAMFEAADKPWQTAMIAMLFFTGVRRAELAAVKLADLDLAGGRLLVHGKGSKERIVPLNGELVGILREYLAQRVPRKATETLLLNAKGTALMAGSIWAWIRVLAWRAGLGTTRVYPHRLRATFATFLAREVSPFTVQKLMGHSSVTTTQRYVGVFPDDMRAAVGTLHIAAAG